MSGVAKRSKVYVDMPIEASKPKDNLHMSFSGGSGKMPDGCKLNAEVVLVVRGKVTGLRADQYGQSLDLEIKSVEKKNA